MKPRLLTLFIITLKAVHHHCVEVACRCARWSSTTLQKFVPQRHLHNHPHCYFSLTFTTYTPFHMDPIFTQLCIMKWNHILGIHTMAFVYMQTNVANMLGSLLEKTTMCWLCHHPCSWNTFSSLHNFNVGGDARPHDLMPCTLEVFPCIPLVRSAFQSITT